MGGLIDSGVRSSPEIANLGVGGKNWSGWIFVKNVLSWEYPIDKGVKLITLILMIIRGEIDFEDLLELENAAWKTSTRVKYFFVTCSQINLGGGNNQGGRSFSKSSLMGEEEINWSSRKKI